MNIKKKQSLNLNKNFFDKFKKGLERFGRSLIVPVSILPIMAMIGAIGYIMISAGKTSVQSIYYTSVTYKTIAEAIKAIGLAPIYNLDILFAIGLATGLAKDEKVSAALCGIAALIGFYFAGNILLKYTSLVKQLPQQLVGKLSTVDRFGKNSNSFNLNALGGILAGYLGYFVHKYTYRLQFPTAIAFFGGPKFSPVATLLVAFLLGMPLTFLWVYIYYLIAQMGQGIRSLKAGGSFLYGFTNRLLLPFGLHNVPNAILRYTAAGGTYEQINGESKTIIEGFYNILIAKVHDNVTITAQDSMISNGTYPTNIFALPGAATAMLLAVPRGKRKLAFPVIFGAVTSSILSGVTEPIEFTFIFAAPILWIAHCFMTGLTYMFMYISGAGMIAGTGEGIITWILYNATAYKIVNRVWMLWVLGPIFFLEYLIVFYLLIWKLNLKTPGR
ncbi:PTS transporter subunit EIIC, partial [Mycoplasmopsis cricetuli]|uniref:PTS transporter subunit EIIC n=1 Tax=Mycoplasmopsis cricetuli TaxID=171283 RepID=UPI00046EF8A1